MTNDQTFVIVGASLAGAEAAETLREEGFDGRLLLIGSEAQRPYERPPLSKDYLRGELEREQIYVHPEGFDAEQAIELRCGRTAVSLDVPSRELALDDGERVRYDRLLLTTGAEPRKLSIPGADLYLRSVEDSDAVRERIDRGGEVVVVRAGWIRAEVAACARQRGLAVTVIDPNRVPLERVLGAEVGVIYRDLHTTASECASSTGTTRFTRARPPRAICSGTRWGTTREFIAFWLTGDRVVAGMNFNVWDVTDTLQRLIRSRAAGDDEQLADPGVALETLAPQAEGRLP